MTIERNKGEVIEVNGDNAVTINEDYTVMYHGFPIGSLKDNLTWFKESPEPKHNEITTIVYLGDYTWGLRELTCRLREFEALPKDLKKDLLERLLEVEQDYNSHTTYNDL